MGELSYQRRQARARLTREYGHHGHLSGMRIRKLYLGAGSAHGGGGAQVRVTWAKGIIQRWKEAVRLGIPASGMHYPECPESGGRLHLRSRRKA